MKLLFRILLLISALLVVFLVIGMMLPSQLQVESSSRIKTTVNNVYVQLIDYKTMPAWLSWSTKDRTMVYRYEGSDAGVGTIMHWQSQNPEISNGSQKIIEAETDKYVKNIIAMNGMPRAYSSFRLTSNNDHTVVNWRFDMQFGFNIPARIRGLFLRDIIEQHYRKSLKNLKIYLEQKKL